jgi:aminoglycoside phosphotransferase (APT) family kinase protein
MANAASAVRPGEELDLAKLNAYLKTVPGSGSVRNVHQFPGGYSNLTYLLTTDAGTSVPGTSVPGTELVLRRPPFRAAAKGGHDMGREYRVLTALRAAGYPRVPEPLFFCDDETVLGTPFYGMERVPGVILRANDATNPALTPERMRLRSERLIDALAELHALDVTRPELAALGKPEGYVRRQVEGWTGRYGQAQTDAVPAMDEVAAWLMEHVPAEQVPAFLHNDFKFDNVVWNEDLTEIRAVLDWEMATLGDPLMDLGAALAYWVGPGDSDFLKQFNLTHLPGTLSRREAAGRYATATGRDLSQILFYYVFGLYKNAVILQQIYARWKAGHTRDPRFGGLLVGVRALSEQAIRAIRSEVIS